MTIKEYLEKEVKHNTGTDGALIVNKIALSCIGKRPIPSVLYELENSIMSSLSEENPSTEDIENLIEQKEQIQALIHMIYVEKLLEA